ncbi:putative ribonuclease H-like domain-containing protein [Tanacetum coccineum]
MDSGVGKMPDLNFHEDDAMDDSNTGLNSGWLNSMSTPQGQFQVFSTPNTQVNMAPQFQDSFITPVYNSTTTREQHVDVVMEDVLREKQPGRIKKKGWNLLPPYTQLPPTTPVANPKTDVKKKKCQSDAHAKNETHLRICLSSLVHNNKHPPCLMNFKPFTIHQLSNVVLFHISPNFKVYKGFWDRILCFTDMGLLDDSHIEAFIRLCVYKRPPDANWTAVDTFFTVNLINNNYERVIKYASGHFGYPNWKTCSVVYIPIHDEQSNHWIYSAKKIISTSQSLVNFTIMSPRSKPSKQYYGCRYFIWKDDLDLQLRVSSSHGPSAPQGSSPRPSTNPSSYHELSAHPNSSPGYGPTECSNCKVKDLRIKMLEARLKMLETRLEMERHPEDHACESSAMLHELLNDMENLRME